MTAETENRQFRFTGWHMLACLVAFFGVIITVNVTMAVIASKTWTGLVVENSYVESQNFNSKLASAEAQRARGWTSHLAYENGELSFTLRDSLGNPLGSERITVALGRPAFEQQDRTIVLERQSDGRYAKSIDLPEGGWQVDILASAGGNPYRRKARLSVDGKGNGELE